MLLLLSYYYWAMPRGKANNTNSGPPCAFCANSMPSEEAINCCECSEIAHRYCAAVSMKEFKDPNSPYICVRCQKAAYMKTIEENEGHYCSS